MLTDRGRQAHTFDHLDELLLQAALHRRRRRADGDPLQPRLHADDPGPAGSADRRQVVGGLVGRDETLVPHVLGGALEAMLIELLGEPEQGAQRRGEPKAVGSARRRRVARRSSSCGPVDDPGGSVTRRCSGIVTSIRCRGMLRNPCSAPAVGPLTNDSDPAASWAASARPARDSSTPATATTPRNGDVTSPRWRARDTAERVMPSCCSWCHAATQCWAANRARTSGRFITPPLGATSGRKRKAGFLGGSVPLGGSQERQKREGRVTRSGVRSAIVPAPTRAMVRRTSDASIAST